MREVRPTTPILGIIQERGKQGLPLERVYRLLFQRDLYLMAYGKIYRNDGAPTRGSTSETVDEMSLQKIATIIEALRSERDRWTPTRRVYFEPTFSNSSHGFRPRRGCHTALRQIDDTWQNTFMMGDSCALSVNSSRQDTWRNGRPILPLAVRPRAVLSRLLQCCKKSGRVRVPGGNPASSPSRCLWRWF